MKTHNIWAKLWERKNAVHKKYGCQDIVNEAAGKKEEIL